MAVAVEAPAWAAYAAGSEVEHFSEFCRLHCIQSVDDFNGLPLELEEWQIELMGEALAYDERGWPFWRGFTIEIPRKCGKTHLLAAYALYRLLTSDGSPEILMAAASDRQAGRLFDAAVSFVRRSPTLSSLVRVRDYVGEIEREDGLGKVLRMSTDPNTLHGYNPSIVICDELAQWRTPSLRKAWAALTTGGGARRAPQTFVISTAGEAQERDTGILGSLLRRLEAAGEVAKRPGLTIARDFKSRRMAYAYESPSSDPMAVDQHKLANPASWITTGFLLEQASNPELSPAEFLQLHANVWSEPADAWIKGWDDLAEPGEIPAGSEVCAGVDIGLTHDSSSVVLAWPNPDTGRVRLEAHVWATRLDAVAHEHVDVGGRFRLSTMEDYLRDQADRFVIREVAYDPRFFEKSAQDLSDEGFVMVELDQSSKPMADAYQGFYQACEEALVEHDGDAVFASHVKSTVAKKTDRGWRVGKSSQRKRIDACVAAVMAHYRASLVTAEAWAEAW